MDPNAIILLLGLCTFPVYVAYREAVSDGRHAVAWAAAEVSILVLLIIWSLATQGHMAWGPYGYAALLCLSYWRLFKLQNSSEAAMPLTAIVWVLGIALVIGILFFCITISRYAFVRQGENRTEVYDRFTGEHHY